MLNDILMDVICGLRLAMAFREEGVQAEMLQWKAADGEPVCEWTELLPWVSLLVPIAPCHLDGLCFGGNIFQLFGSVGLPGASVAPSNIVWYVIPIMFIIILLTLHVKIRIPISLCIRILRLFNSPLPQLCGFKYGFFFCFAEFFFTLTVPISLEHW